MTGQDVLRVAGIALALLVPAPALAQVVLHEVSGMVWRDRVSDGVRNPHEQALGVPQFTVELRDATTLAVLRTTTTDADGRYTFSFGSTQGVRSYRIAASLSVNYARFSPLRAGGDPTIDNDVNPAGPNVGQSDGFVVAVGAPATHIDVGLVPYKITIGNLAWFDRNDDGLQHEFEPGLQGVVVEGWDTDRTVRYAQVTTDVDGIYRLDLPGWGPYRLRFEAPPGTSFTQRFVGSDRSVDSDVIATGPNAGWTGVIEISSSTLSITQIDAGYLVPDDGADVALIFDEAPLVVFPGFSASWSLRVREGLNRIAESVRVQVQVPAGIQGMSWTCQAVSGATCPAAGTGAPDFVARMPYRSELRIDFAGQVATSVGPVITGSAVATVAPPQWDAFPQNNTAVLTLRNDVLFRTGFQ